MAIYDAQGNQLLAVYDAEGNSLDYAYDAEGNVLFQKDADEYAYYTIEQMYNTTRGNKQGMDIYGNYMVIFDGTSNNLIFVNLTTLEIDYTIPTGLSTHGNDISFSSVFYDPDDEFPLLFIETRHGFRIDVGNLSAEEVVTLTISPSGNTWNTFGTAFNADSTKYYCMGYNTSSYADSSGFIWLETWDISNGFSNPVRESILTRQWFPCIQGVVYHDGLLWVASGMGDPVKVYAINPSDASIVKTIDLTYTGELEGIGWGYDENDGNYFCVYGQIYNGATYFRIDFSSTPISS